MTVSFPTPDGPDTMTSSAPGAPGAGAPRATVPATAGSGTTVTQPPESGLEVHRQRRLGADEPAGRGRRQLQAPGVEEQPREPVRPAPARAATVDRVARDRMPDRRQVNADLVRPARDEVELQERPAIEPLADPIAGRRGTSRGRHGHPR